MRTLLILSAFVMLLSAACKKGSGKTSKIVGTWKLTETSHIGAPWTAATNNQEITLVLNNNGTYSIITPPISMYPGCSGTYTFENDILTLSPDRQASPAHIGPLLARVNTNTLELEHMITSSGFKTKYIRQ